MYNNVQIIISTILGSPPVGFEFIEYIVSCVIFFYVLRVILSPFIWVLDMLNPKKHI